MRLGERKRVELCGKLEDLCAEFDRWLADAEPGGPLRKHRSQISRLTNQLRGMVERIADEVRALPGADEVRRLPGADPAPPTVAPAALSADGPQRVVDVALRESRRLQLELLEVHRLWDYFRAKLVLRRVEFFRPYLAAVDEFAWDCFRPALERDARHRQSSPEQKESPLVYLSGDFSPFIHLRHQPFAVQQVPDALDTLEFLKLTYALPVPVIGMPWYQVGHLPDAIVIAHEVGHSVERDLELTSTTEGHLQTVAAHLHDTRRSGWFAWLPEVFADLYATLAAGPAFASGLADLLATDPMWLAGERPGPPWADHPPASLRIALVSRALTRTGFEAEAVQGWREWITTYPPTTLTGDGKSGTFFDDVNTVVDALLGGVYPQFGKVPLTTVISFSPTQQRRAAMDADRVLGNADPNSDDIRCLMASARLAFEKDPVTYRTAVPGRLTSHQLLAARIEQIINDAPRGIERREDPQPSADQAAGAALIDLMGQLKRRRVDHRSPPKEGTNGHPD
ncbi:MAG TPA: hypothetical protein VFY84_07345 [Jiangellales bacterium]|nr:hypothetical protein [Jiangellales bacterium]